MVQTSKEIQKLSVKMDINQVSRTKSILNANQIQALYNATPQRYKYKRPAKGGGEWDYIKVGHVRRELDKAFGFNWDFDIETTLGEAFEVAKLTKQCIVKGILKARTMVDGQWIELKKVQFGRADVKFIKNTMTPLDMGNDFKGASSDALKKCASLLGIGSDIYEADEFVAIEIIEADDNSDKKKATEEKVKKMVKELKAEEVNE